MAVSRRPAPVNEVDLEQTAELPVIDFTGTHAELVSPDNTVSVATLGVEDSLSRTDTYAVPTLNGAAALTDNLRDVEERLHRKSERVAALERELDGLRAAERELQDNLRAQLAQAQADAERDIAAERAAAEEEISALRAQHDSALRAAQSAAADNARQLTQLTARYDETNGRVQSLETRLGQHIATLSSQEKELAQRSRRIDELQKEFAQASSLARELGEARDTLAARAQTLDSSLSERTAVLEARVGELAQIRAQLARSETAQARMLSERDDLRGCVDRQLEALHRLEGYRGVADSQIAEHEFALASSEAEIAELKVQLLQLAERDERIAGLESQLASLRDAAARQEQRVSSLSTDGQALERRLVELNEALTAADRSSLAQSEALRVAAQHAAEIEAQLTTERERAGTLASELATARSEHVRELQQLHTNTSKDLQAARAAAASELSETRAATAAELDRVRADASGELERQRVAAAAELERVRSAALAEQERLQSAAAAELAMVREARDALTAQLAERDAEVVRLSQAQAQLGADIAARERAIAEREQAVTELLDGQQEQLSRQTGELLAAQETARRAEGDLHAAEEQLRHLEAEQRHRESRLEELGRSNESVTRRLDEVLARLAERDDQLRRVETEAHASNAVLGKLQQSIQRLSRDDTGTRPIIADPPLDAMSRLLVRVDGGVELTYTIGRRTTLGRTPDNDIRLDANFVSRHHAVMLASSKNTIIEDLNSTNGVVVNGRRVTRQPLQHGDVVSIGTAEFRFELRPLGNAGDPA
jgi:chromosome segregation ATPase